MPAWIHSRAEHLMAKNPSMPKGQAFAIATQQSHALGKSPKSYGTIEGRTKAKEKYKTPSDDQKKANPLVKAGAEQRFRPIRGVLLDASIPVVRIGSDGVTSLQSALEKNKGKESTWSHAQVAVPKDKVDLKALGFSKTRLAIPLPGESWGTPSYRHGELHAHEAGPFLLVHRDESAPGAGLFAHLTKDVPDALRKRFSGKIAPFVQEKPMANRELQKAAMEAFIDEYHKIAFTTSEYAGPMGTAPFQQASQLPAFRAPGLKAAIEKPQQKIAALTPAGRLVSTQRKGTGMGAAVTGPSIAEVAKPPRIGHAMPGALKNQI